MSDVNATPVTETVEAPAAATPEVAAAQTGEPSTSAVSESSSEPVAVAEPAAPVQPEPVMPTATSHESLLARIEGLPADGVAFLHDVLAHVTEGVDDFALSIGLGRLKSLFEKVKSRL